MFIKNGKLSISSILGHSAVNIKDVTGETHIRPPYDRSEYFQATTDPSSYGVFICAHGSELDISENDYLIPTQISGIGRTSASTSITATGSYNWTFVCVNNNATPVTIKSISLAMSLQDYSEDYLIYEENIPERVVGAGETFTFTFSTIAN